MYSSGSAFASTDHLFGAGNETPQVVIICRPTDDGGIHAAYHHHRDDATEEAGSNNNKNNNEQTSLLASSQSGLLGDDYDRPAKVQHRMRYLTCIAAIGGFLSGYNTGVISGALLPLTRVFHLSPEQEESIVTATIVSAFVFSLIGGSLNQFAGRRATIMGAAVVFVLGAVTLFCAESLATLILGEVLLGAAIGVESLTSPLYISEVAKPGMRGMLVSAYAFMVCFGQFASGLVDGVAGAHAGGWRFMFGMAALPGTVLWVGFCSLPESPAWLMNAGREDEAAFVLHSVRDSNGQVQDECDEIRDSIRCSHQQDADDRNVNRGTLLLWRNRGTRNALLVGCSLMVMQQCCGANVVMYYSATIYRMSGFAELTAIWLAAVTALAQLVGLTLSVFYVEKMGRRPLLLLSFAGVSVCLIGLQTSFYLARVLSPRVDLATSDLECQRQPALVWDGVSRFCYDCSQMQGCGYCNGACFRGDEAGPLDPNVCQADDDWQYDVCKVPKVVSWMPVLFMILYLIVFGIGAGGLPWTVNSELYPIQCRSLAVAISTGTNWFVNLLVSSSFLTISDPSVLTVSGSFGLYAIITIVGVFGLYYNLPETKGASLDQLNTFFSAKHSDATTFTATDSPSLYSSSRDSESGNAKYGSIER